MLRSIVLLLSVSFPKTRTQMTPREHKNSFDADDFSYSDDEDKPRNIITKLLLAFTNNGRKEMFYLTTHSTFMVIWRRTYRKGPLIYQ